MQAILLGVLIAVPIGLFGVLYTPALLRLMGASPGVIANASFTTVMLGANGVIMLLFLINAVFRGAGDAAIAMRVLWIANAINICLDPCLIFGLGPFPELGVTGAAVATTTGRGIGVLVQLYALARQRGRVTIRREHLRLDPAVMLTMMRLSGSAVVQGLIPNLGWLGLVRILATFGSDALAGFAIAFRVVVFALLPAWGLANAAATLVGQNLGAGQAGSGRDLGLAHLFLQSAVPGRGGVRVRRASGAAGRRLHGQSGGGRQRRARAADCQQRLSVLRVCDGADASLQRRRRHR